ncbi:hypothetical protein LCGC14_1980720 [marine sediment metagenome]|uniref:Methyltransferase type 11 domain-containing protein n=1 Tax=marine sediment metagenome TaxID=412755 RepID=A0A0F9F8Z5_9ZZZZ
MKLNVGCSWPKGRYRSDEWTNFDIIKNERVDLVGSVLDIPLPTNSVEEIHCVHLLEHLTRDKYPQALREMHRVLEPDGVLYVETPDFMGIVENLHTAILCGNTEAIHVWTTSIYGKSEREGMSHHWGFYEGLLRREFRNQGFHCVDRLTETEDMISTHYKQEPVLLIRGTK